MGDSGLNVKVARCVALLRVAGRYLLWLAGKAKTGWFAARRASNPAGQGTLSPRLTAEFTQEELRRHRTMLADPHELRLPEDPELCERLLARSELLRSKFAKYEPILDEDTPPAGERNADNVLPLRRTG